MEQQIQGSDSGKNVKELNGVNLERLNETVSNIKGDLDLAKFKFRTENHWVNGAYNRIDIKPFYGCGKDYNDRDVRFSIEADSPDILLGTDKATDPVGYLLGALSSCLTTTIAYHSAAKGITINKLSSTFEGDIDLQGFLGLSGTVKKGFKEIRVNFDFEINASESELREIIKFSPVYEMVSAGVPVK